MRRLVLVDADGGAVAVLEAASGSVRFVAPAGGPARAIELSLAPEGPSLRLRDDAGRVRVSMTAERRGSGVAILDERDRLRAELRTIQGNAELLLRDEQGRARVGAGTAGEAAGLVLYDTEAQARATLELARGRARLLLADAERVGRILLQAGAPGETGMQLRDPEGRPRWQEVEPER